ncbi:MAG TPA: hypothetical protein VNF29_09410 [Candidatus Binataceae bacterium]|nr:hypothetical protein [Candidatus Binataceae bacterium]
MRQFLKTIAILAAVQLFIAGPAFAAPLDSAPSAATPFVVCNNQRYALCAEASCFIYDSVAYCKCDIKRGDSISLQLSYSSPQGQKNVCDVNQEGKHNGYMVSTFSLPNNVKKGGTAAVYTCPGTANAGSGVAAPVAYGQCDGAICFTSSKGQRFPGFDGRLRHNEDICSCPISTDATAGSSDSAGYQIFGPYDPSAPAGSRCDASACAACSVPSPTDNGTTIPVGAPTGSGEFLALTLDGPPPPVLNQCLCTCSQTSGAGGGITCTLGADITP